MAALVVGAAALRAPLLDAAFPYYAYVDEGHVLRRVVHMLADGTWDPAWYRYPSLLMTLIAAIAWIPLRRAPAAREALAATDVSRFYDVLEPAGLLLVGRGLVFASAVGTVAVVGWLGARLAGRRVGAAAALLAAVLPALVARSAVVVVDTPSAFFAVAALAVAAHAGAALTPHRGALAGLAAGLAAATKYPAGVVLVAVLTVIAGARAPLGARLAAAGAAVAACLGALAVGSPALVLRTARVLAELRVQSEAYATYAPTPDYLAQARTWIEAGPVFLALAALGALVLVRLPRARRVTLGWLLFGALLVGTLVRYPFQPFRNLLPLLPFACVAAAAALDRLARVAAPRRTGAATALLTVAVATPMVAWGVVPHLARHARMVDTRVVVREWLAEHRRAGESVLVAEELTFLPGELGRLGEDVVVRPWGAVAHGAQDAGWTWLVVPGRFDGEPPTLRDAWGDALGRWRLALDVGSTATPGRAGIWRGNAQRILVYRGP